jgi:hypothetical protein
MGDVKLEAIKAAAEALSDLNTFAIVVSILEGGHLHAPSYAAAERIIKISHRAQRRCLVDYDRAIAKAKPSSPPHHTP